MSSSLQRSSIVRDSIGKIVRLLSEKDITVTLAGNSAHVEYHPITHLPTKMNLPMIDDQTSEEMLIAIHGFVDHEVGHVLFSDPQKIQKASKERVQSLHNIIEDTFIESRMQNKFKGSKSNLELMHTIFTKEHIDTELNKLGDDSETSMYWGALVACAFRAWAGQQHFVEYMSDKWELIEPYCEKLGELVSEVPNVTNSEEALDLAIKVRDRLNDKKNPEGSSGEREQQEKNKGKESSDEDNTEKSKKGSSEKNQESDHQQSDEKDKEEIEYDDREVTDFDDALKKLIQSMAKKEGDDKEYAPFSKDWDFIGPVDDITVSGREVDFVQNSVNEHIRRITRKMELMFRAANKSRFIKGKRAGRLSQDSLHRLATNDSRVFKRKTVKETNEVAVSLLVDCSGSMSGPKIKLACQVAWAMSDVLDRLNINNEVLGFTTSNKARSALYNDVNKRAKQISYDEYQNFTRIKPIYMPVFKSFSERFTNTQKKRLTQAALSKIEMSGNVDGESVIYAAERLLKQKERSKTLIVLSDGMPAVDNCSHRVGEMHLVDSIKKVEKSGISCVGIGIQDDSVKNFYKKSIVAHQLEDLPEKVMNELKAILFN